MDQENLKRNPCHSLTLIGLGKNLCVGKRNPKLKCMGINHKATIPVCSAISSGWPRSLSSWHAPELQIYFSALCILWPLPFSGGESENKINILRQNPVESNEAIKIFVETNGAGQLEMTCPHLAQEQQGQGQQGRGGFQEGQ
ncbi:hypothetical protein ACET3Z_028203 [Daucus carota]